MDTIANVVKGLVPVFVAEPVPETEVNILSRLEHLAATSGCQAGELCGGMGAIRFDVPMGHPAFGKAFTCACQTRRTNMRRAARLFADAQVPDRYTGLDFDSLETLPLAGKEEALAVARAFADVHSFQARGGIETPDGLRRGLVFYGPVGRGKTGLSVSIFRAWLQAGYSGLWITYEHLVDKIKATYNNHSEVSAPELIAGAQRVDLLVIDDLGDIERGGGPVQMRAASGSVENPAFAATDHHRDIAYKLVDFRHSFLLPTIITTNLNPDAGHLDAQFGVRIADRVRELCHMVCVAGVNLRT